MVYTSLCLCGVYNTQQLKRLPCVSLPLREHAAICKWTGCYQPKTVAQYRTSISKYTKGVRALRLAYVDLSGSWDTRGQRGRDPMGSHVMMPNGPDS